MRFLIIGLGIYGSNLATDLAALGHEVIGADIRGSIVEGIKDFISTAYILDSTDATALSVLPLNNVDVVIVAIGENFGASVKTVAILKKLNVASIYARAIDPLHESILQGMGVTRILTPEQRAALDLVNEMALGSEVNALKVDDDNYVLCFAAPPFFHDMTYDTLDLENHYGVKLVAATRSESGRNAIGMPHNHARLIKAADYPSAKVMDGDMWTCFGPLRKLQSITGSKL